VAATYRQHKLIQSGRGFGHDLTLTKEFNMKLFEKLLTGSKLADELFKTDLAEKSEDRKACVSRINQLKIELDKLPTKKQAEAEKVIADAALKLEIARREYADLSATIERHHREINKALKAEEKKLTELAPLVVLQTTGKLNEKVKSGSLRLGSVHQASKFYDELFNLVHIVDDALLLRRVAEIDKHIDAEFI
jgi:hypothetical protein